MMFLTNSYLLTAKIYNAEYGISQNFCSDSATGANSSLQVQHRFFLLWVPLNYQ